MGTSAGVDSLNSQVQQVQSSIGLVIFLCQAQHLQNKSSHQVYFIIHPHSLHFQLYGTHYSIHLCSHRLSNTGTDPPTYDDRRGPRGENPLISALMPELTPEQRVFVGQQ